MRFGKRLELARLLLFGDEQKARTAMARELGRKQPNHSFLAAKRRVKARLQAAMQEESHPVSFEAVGPKAG